MDMNQTKKIAVLGLGAMGARMASRLLEFGHAVTLYNRNPARADSLVQAGAKLAKTPKEAAKGQDLIIACVRDDEAARTIWADPEQGALAGMNPETIAIDSSTLTPECARELAQTAKKAGIRMLDAPVVGSRPQAEAGQLIYLVGGDASDLSIVQPLLEQLGRAVHHCGPSGSGAIVKLIVNALFGIQATAVAELLSFADKSGLSQQQTLDILGDMPVMSPAARGVGSLMVAGQFAPMFPIELVAKDFSYASASARAVGAEIPTTKAAGATFERAQKSGLGDLNISGIHKLFFG